MKNMLKMEEPYNASLSPVFEYGYTGPGTDDISERSRARREFSVCDVEKALTVSARKLRENAELNGAFVKKAWIYGLFCKSNIVSAFMCARRCSH